MSTKRAVFVLSLAFLLGAFLSVSRALRAADVSGDSKEVTDLLGQAKSEALQLQDDAATMESYTQSNMSWQSHAMKITEIKDHVNTLGQTVGKLTAARGTASLWQQTAIDRINPILRELAANVEATINHLDKDRTHPLQSTAHKDYLKANAELASRMATVISDFVDYGDTKTRFEDLSRKLEIAER